MDLVLDRVSKLYSDQWVFRGLSVTIDHGQSWAIRGYNGSGKSTLLSMILGLTIPTEGVITYLQGGQKVSREDAPGNMSFCAPYMSVPQELSSIHLIRQYNRFRSFYDALDERGVLELAQLWPDRNKAVSQYSTGMAQRLKLSLAFATRSDVVILDEPTSNLDKAGKKWFLELVDKQLKERTLLIASNDPFDLDICDKALSVTDFKP